MHSLGLPSRALVDNHLDNGGWMLLHDAFGVNCEKGATTDQDAGAWYMGSGGVCWMRVWVQSHLTCLPLLDGGRKSWYIIIMISDHKFL